MTKKWIFLASTLIVLIACRTPEHSPSPHSEPVARTPQQVHFIGEEIDPEFEKIFQAALEATNNKAESGESDVIEGLIERQKQIFHLTSSQVAEYDRELDRLYKMKIADPKKDLDLSAFNQMKIKMAISWEFNENNSHKLEYIYGRLLQESNSANGPLKKNSSLALNKMDQMMKQGWQSPDQRAYQSMIENLELINKSFEIRKPGSKFPEFRKLFNTPVSNKLKNLQKWDNKTVEHEFNKFRIEREADRLKIIKERMPQSETGKADIKPDPGPSGNINGSGFPKGAWAITLDDGPHGTFTRAMMDELERAGLKGHFFWLTREMQRYPQIVQEARQRGFKLALHSHSHANLHLENSEGLTRQIDRAADIFESIVGQRPTFFRCPYGNCGKPHGQIRQRIANQQMIHASWNVDTLDWQSGSSQEVFERARKGMVVMGGGIVLFHDIQGRTVGALRLLGEYMKTRPEWKTYTLDELVSMRTGQNYESP